MAYVVIEQKDARAIYKGFGEKERMILDGLNYISNCSNRGLN